MVRKRYDRTVVKKCSECERQVPVACKFCTCGHQFAPKNKIPQKTEDSKEEPVLGRRRRPERTRKERPDFFMISELSRHIRKPRQRQESSSSGTGSECAKKKRGRPRGSGSKPKTETPEPKQNQDDDMYTNMSAEKAMQFHVILADMNRRLQSQCFKPD